MLTYTNHIDPANRVIASAMRFWTFSPRCLACATSAGCSGVLTLGRIAICRLLPAQPGHALPGTATSVSITPYAAVDPARHEHKEELSPQGIQLVLERGGNSRRWFLVAVGGVWVPLGLYRFFRVRSELSREMGSSSAWRVAAATAVR